ncbi:MAG: hypothetical protein R3F53_19285 [Gammaproteobacteria bacterium]
MSAQRKAKRLKADDQEERQVLQFGIAERLESTLSRRGDFAARAYWQADNYSAACMDVARYFVESVWPESFEERIPSLERLRNIKSIYRMAFIQCYQPREKVNGDDENEPEAVQSDLF